MADPTNLALKESVLAGAVLVLVASDDVNGNTFVNNGRTIIHANNDTAGAITLTFASVAKCSQGETHNLAVSIDAGAVKIIGPFDQGRFNDAAGKVGVTYSASGVDVAAVKI